MKYVTVYFDVETIPEAKPYFWPGLEDYKRLLEVFKLSVAKSDPDSELVVINLPKITTTTEESSIVSNHIKLQEWNRYVQEEMNEDTVILDCDTMVLKSTKFIFNDYDFDIAISNDDIAKPPKFSFSFDDGAEFLDFNAGIVWVRNNKKAKNFFNEWAYRDNEIYEILEKKGLKKTNSNIFNNSFFPYGYREKGGINKKAFLYILEHKSNETNILHIPGSKSSIGIHNSRIGTKFWQEISDEEREIPSIIHFLGEFRAALTSDINLESFPPILRKIAELWRGYEKEIFPEVKHERTRFEFIEEYISIIFKLVSSLNEKNKEGREGYENAWSIANKKFTEILKENSIKNIHKEFIEKIIDKFED